MILVACGGPETGDATLTGVLPPGKSSSATPFDIGLGWTINFFESEPGSDCTREEDVIATISIFTNQTGKPQAILATGDVPIVVQAPPTVIGDAAANMSANLISEITGTVSITDFHVTPDGTHGDLITGTVEAGGKTASGTDVLMSGTFAAPLCEE